MGISAHSADAPLIAARHLSSGARW